MVQLELIFGNAEKYKITCSFTLKSSYQPKYTFKVGALGTLASLTAAVFCSYFGHEMVQETISDHSVFNSEYVNTVLKGAGLLTGVAIGGLSGILIASGLPGGEQKFEK